MIYGGVFRRIPRTRKNGASRRGLVPRGSSLLIRQGESVGVVQEAERWRVGLYAARPTAWRPSGFRWWCQRRSVRLLPPHCRLGRALAM